MCMMGTSDKGAKVRPAPKRQSFKRKCQNPLAFSGQFFVSLHNLTYTVGFKLFLPAIKHCSGAHAQNILRGALYDGQKIKVSFLHNADASFFTGRISWRQQQRIVFVVDQIFVTVRRYDPIFRFRMVIGKVTFSIPISFVIAMIFGWFLTYRKFGRMKNRIVDNFVNGQMKFTSRIEWNFVDDRYFESEFRNVKKALTSG
uniref:Uncharacterized protein n=1 Tax=Romanomermis culicivorax TaxID=13658 RepID=A0A915IPH5_ROMCU